MRFLLPLLLVLSCLTVLLPGCEPKEDLVTTDSSAMLSFSTDTVKFDTVFTTVGTVTKRLWVYNRNSRAVKVEEIGIQSQPGVTYSLLIDGDAGATARDKVIRGKDSLLVLVRATIDPTPSDEKPFLVENDLRFRTNGNDQQVKVVSYGQNAYFHDNVRLACDAIWKADKPHVIYNVALVDSGCTLTIEPGARIYSHAGAFLVVKGSLRINSNYKPAGELKPDDRNIVRFQGDRREQDYTEAPGQWGGLEFDASSHDNIIRFTEIKNASFGLLIYNPYNRQPRPKVTVENSVIKNISSASLDFASGGLSLQGAGLLGLSGDFTVRNTLLTNCWEYAIWGVQGCVYQLDYCTIANYITAPGSSPIRQTPSVLLADNIKINNQARPIVAPRFTMRNSIVWAQQRFAFTGGGQDEILFLNGERYAGNISITNSILLTKEYTAGPLSQNKNGNILNPTEGPNYLFKSTPARLRGKTYSYELDTLSAASNKGVPLPGVTIDLLNRPRDPATPDIGAYERKNP
ncbi:hypothetical protein HMJ29_06995 [Hymenobacter taeanensis]|uniref:Right-handed parallel beta-helix repeat-containing protein n=1 Tax=Hymenobacter taeanensis TaxID=2735321 RepID=A0A6M6BFU1_9BACT|nr:MULTISPECIES: hypothetical protein [Hymenobacter]QJX46698.1 hypothetical protein HMJ29_06995 [Hymenobacter taeanensis]UOQ80563.1 hypothetical protein MUN83_17340 [Hymenobacter sp. 5414T-23]